MTINIFLLHSAFVNKKVDDNNTIATIEQIMTDFVGETLYIDCFIPQSAFVAGENEVMIDAKVSDVQTDVTYTFLGISREKLRDDERFYLTNHGDVEKPTTGKQEMFAWSMMVYKEVYKGSAKDHFETLWKDDYRNWQPLSQT